MPRRASAPKPASLAAALQSPTSTVLDPEPRARADPRRETEEFVAHTSGVDVELDVQKTADAAETDAAETDAGAQTDTGAGTDTGAETDTGVDADAGVEADTAPAQPEPSEREADPGEAVPSEAPVAVEARVAVVAPEPEIVEPTPAPTLAPSRADAVGRAEKPDANSRIEEPKTETEPVSRAIVLDVDALSKSFDGALAVDHVSLAVRSGSIFGIVGPNGAGKTTTLSMITGLLRPDSGRVLVHGADVWKDPVAAKRNMGVLPDRLRLFDRLTGAQLLYYSGTLRGLSRKTVKSRSADLAVAFGLEEALGRLVTDYSAGMTKKIALAAALIHSPRLLVLDEPFEAVDPVSAANVIEILQKYTAAGGTVIMSSHSMDLIQRVCDSVSIIVRGSVLASGSMDEVRAGGTLEDRFVELAGGRKAAEGMEWLHSFSA